MKMKDNYQESRKKVNYIVHLSLNIQKRQGLPISKATPIALDLGRKVLKAQERKRLKKKHRTSQH